MVKNVLITGGTGTFGVELAKWYLAKTSTNRVVIFSRDELKQSQLSQTELFKDPRVRFFIGDVRDHARLRMAAKNIDVIVHAAAMKHVDACEYNPFEAIKTNIIGAQNVIDVALELKIPRIVALSTDKAAGPINLYGATKLCSDKLFTAANNLVGSEDIRFSVVRYGNVFGSRGSVVPYFRSLIENSMGEVELPITDVRMTRFSISIQQGVEEVIWAVNNCLGGEICIPKIPSYRILDLAEAFNPGGRVNVVGLRAGEKLYEEMITPSDGRLCMDCGSRYILPSYSAHIALEAYKDHHGGALVPEGFSYRSDENLDFMSVKQLEKLIAHYNASI